MTQLSVAEVAITGTGVSLSSPVVYGPGQCAESMLCVVRSRGRSSPPRRMRLLCWTVSGSPQCPQSGESASRILCRRSLVGSMSCIGVYCLRRPTLMQVISHPLQSPVPLPSHHHGPLSLPLKPDPHYQECATFDIRFNQTSTTVLFSPLQC